LFLSESSDKIQAQILTPDDPDQRGAQLSFRILNADPKQVLTELGQLGVVVCFLYYS
jgi:selenocysteine lyase/cysteine desulfurase